MAESGAVSSCGETSSSIATTVTNDYGLIRNPASHPSLRLNKRKNPASFNYDGDSYWQAEEIRDVKIDAKKKRLLYEVKWPGYSDSDNSWVPKSNCSLAAHLIEKFHHKFPNKSRNIVQQIGLNEETKLKTTVAAKAAVVATLLKTNTAAGAMTEIEEGKEALRNSLIMAMMTARMVAAAPRPLYSIY